MVAFFTELAPIEMALKVPLKRRYKLSYVETLLGAADFADFPNAKRRKHQHALTRARYACSLRPPSIKQKPTAIVALASTRLGIHTPKRKLIEQLRLPSRLFEKYRCQQLHVPHLRIHKSRSPLESSRL